MKTLSVLLLVVIASLPAMLAAQAPNARPDAAVIDPRVRATVSALAERGVLSEPDWWMKQLSAGEAIDGDRVAQALVKGAGILKLVQTIEQAIAVMHEKGIITSTEYWTSKAVAGKTCAAKDVTVVLTRLASRLPIAPPPSVNAAPLKPISLAETKPAYDVVIAGAGTGGFGAAVQAARMGASVLVLEETDWIGGQMNAAAVTSMDEGPPLARERGVCREICGHIWAHYQPMGINPETAYGFRHPAVEPRIGQKIMYAILGDARGNGRLDVVLCARVAAVQKQGNTVSGVDVRGTLPGQNTVKRIACKVLIDATEWGDVLPLTGLRYRTGNCTSDAIDPARRVQAITWTAVIRQHPQGKVPAELQLKAPPPGYEALEKSFKKSLHLGQPGELAKPPQGSPWSWDRFIGYRAMPDGTRPNTGDSRTVTRTHLNFNNDYPSRVADIENPESRLATTRDAIRRTLGLLYYIQTNLGKTDWGIADDEGYDTPYNRAQMDALIAADPALSPYRQVLYRFSIIPYVRESRRIIGLHTLNAREIERKPGKPIQFPHTVALGDYAVDLHGSMNPQYLELDLDREEDMPTTFGGRGIGPFAIPFECFIPEKLDGFVPAEKNISQSRMANGATRLQPSTMLMGQAAGAIAALAAKQGVQPRVVDPRQVQHALLDAGCTLSIAPVVAPWGTPQWKQQQMEALK